MIYSNTTGTIVKHNWWIELDIGLDRQDKPIE